MKKKGNTGITLIALVITIIVLLILVGVSIATLTGENGILTQANKAKTENTKTSAKEQVKLEVLGSYGADGKLDYERLKENLGHIDKITGVPKDTITSSNFPLKVTVDGTEIEISEDGQVTLSFNAGEWDKTACEETSFLWASDDPSSGESYHTIVGYADSIQNEVILRIPSRCHVIMCYTQNFETQGRTFAKTFETVELPNTLTKIGGFAFSGFKLTSITIPDGVTSIGDQAFRNCESLVNVTMPEGLIQIEYQAFCECINLKNIIIPESVTSIANTVFENWSSEQTIRCRVDSKPNGWQQGWSANANVVWGYTGE